MLKNIVVSLAAGIISALVLVAATRGSMLSLFAFVFLAPLPIVIVGFGWGWLFASLAALTSAIAMAASVNPNAGIFHFIAVGLPMAICAYLLTLNRQINVRDNNGSFPIEWYPPGRVLAVLALLAGSLAALFLFSLASNERQLEVVAQDYIAQFKSQIPDKMSADDFVQLMTSGLTPVAATLWMTIVCFNLWLGAWVTQISGLLARPWPDLSLMTLPREMPLAFIAAVGLSFLQGYPGLIALGFASAFLLAYIIVGLAIVHNITRGLAARPFIIAAVYVSLLYLNPFSGLIVATIAIAEPISPIRRSFYSSSANGGDRQSR